jgi:hypothetical protein
MVTIIKMTSSGRQTLFLLYFKQTVALLSGRYTGIGRQKFVPVVNLINGE